VLEFDHHCMWLGTCIGKRNYASFLAYLATVEVSLIGAIVCLIMEASSLSAREEASVPRHYFVMPILMLLVVVAFILVSILLGYHLYLIRIGETTNENLKNVYKLKLKPLPGTTNAIYKSKPNAFN